MLESDSSHFPDVSLSSLTTNPNLFCPPMKAHKIIPRINSGIKQRFEFNFDPNNNHHHRQLVLLFATSMLFFSSLACANPPAGQYTEPNTHDFTGTYCGSDGGCIDEDFDNSPDGWCPQTYMSRSLTSCTQRR